MSILPQPRFPKPSQSIVMWAQDALPLELRRWITESRSIEDLFEFISANKNRAKAYCISQGDTIDFDSLAQQQIQTLIAVQTHEQFQTAADEMKGMAKETHPHLMALRLPPISKDPRTYLAFLSGALAGWPRES